MQNHNIFHGSQLDQCTPLVVDQLPSELQPTIVDEPGDEEWEVEHILHSKQRDWKLPYPLQWAGYSNVLMSWEPAEHLDNTQELVDQFHPGHQSEPRS